MTEQEPSPVQGTEPAAVEPPSDYREYNRWRDSGELPEKTEPSAAADQPPAKTDPDSETDDTQEPGETEDETQDTGAAKPKGGSRQRKIDRLTRENEELKRQIAGQTPVKPQDKPSQAPQQSAPAKPKLEDFRTLEDYQEALTDWKIDERERNRAQAEARAAAEETVRKQQTDWADKEKAARKAHADYDDLMDTLQIPVSPGVVAARQALLEDENGAELLYHLARNPKELERIASLPPASAVLAIGRLSASLEQPPATDNGKRKITGAPKPPPPSSRQTAGTSKKDIHDEDFARSDYRGWSKEREAQLKG